ncbi:MAG: formate dehydrogenase subunit alpha [Deltaproteobacteria bacterium]|nr:formate dehydrogenase subunit alpha [Deltaproteobacteria bacterium]
MTAPTESTRASLTLTVNGQKVSVPEGASLLDAARAAGAHVPTLCNSDALKPYGACRVCLVEVDGGRPVASCHTPAREGASIHTQSDRLRRLRKNIVELIVSDHPLDCLGCSANNRCELQTVAAEVGFREVRYPTPTTHNPPRDDTHPFLKLEMDKCIACGRCVRVCDELQGSFVLAMAGRGFDTRVIAGDDTGMAEADCRSCGACAVECPVAAIEDRGARSYGAAEKVVSTTCAYCGVGCTLNAHVVGDAIAMIEPSPKGSANHGHACVKGRFAHDYARHADRLTSPLIRQDDGSYSEASWDEALDLVSTRLAAIRDEHGAGAFANISSSRCTNEENYLFSKFTRTVMGTNSIDNCSRVCHSPSAYGLGKALGTGAGTNSFQDVEHTDCILIVGANPTAAHPVFGARIVQATLAGAKLIVLDPRETELAALADEHLALTPGSNVAVVNALLHVIFAEELVDADFIAAHTEDVESAREAVKSCTPEWAEGISRVPAEQIRRAARLYASVDRATILWGLGVTEAGHGSNAVFGLIDMALATGNMGRLGTGTNPIRGQNNVQGASDVGALPNVFSDYRLVTDEVARAEHEATWGVTPPSDVGLTIPQMFDAACAGTLKAMWIVAEDVAQSDPDTEHVTAALEALEFLVVQEIFMSETAHFADVVFPGATFLEKDGTFVNSDRRIQRVRKALEPLPGTLPDGHIAARVAERMGRGLGFGESPDSGAIMDELAGLSPNWRGVSYARLEGEGAFLQWPCRDADDPGTTIVHEGGDFLRGRALFVGAPWQEPGELPDDDYPFFLTTGRQLFHYNVGTQTRRTPVVELYAASMERLRISPKDAKRLGVKSGDRLRVRSRRGQIEVEAEVTRASKPGTVFMTFHFPETRTNLLIGQAVDEYTGCPEYKVSAVSIEKLADVDTSRVAE